MLIDQTPETRHLVPPFLAELTEFASLYQAQNSLLADYWQALGQLYRDAFPVTAGREALARFLRFLGLPQPQEEGDCRALLLGRLSSQPPLNQATVAAVCRTYLGEEAAVRYFPELALIQVKYPAGAAQAEALVQGVRAMVPAAVQTLVRENYLAFIDFMPARLTWADLDAKNINFSALPDLEL